MFTVSVWISDARAVVALRAALVDARAVVALRAAVVVFAVAGWEDVVVVAARDTVARAVTARDGVFCAVRDEFVVVVRAVTPRVAVARFDAVPDDGTARDAARVDVLRGLTLVGDTGTFTFGAAALPSVTSSFDVMSSSVYSITSS